MKSNEFVDLAPESGFHASCPQSAEEELVVRMMSGDRDAFSMICLKYERRLFRIALRITRNKQDAEDAVQDTFLRAYSRIHTFKCASSISTWLTRIVINSSMSELRRRRGRPTLSLDETGQEGFDLIDVLPDRAIDVENAFACAEHSRLLSDGIARLKPQHRLIIETLINADFSLAEIAGHFGLTVTAAKSRLFRARKALIRSRWIAQAALPVRRLHHRP